MKKMFSSKITINYLNIKILVYKSHIYYKKLFSMKFLIIINYDKTFELSSFKGTKLHQF